MFKRILVTTDFSASALEAARFARRLAGQDAEFRVVHAAPSPVYAPLLRSGDQDVLSRANQEGRRQAKARLNEFVQEAGLDGAEARVLEGGVAEAVAEDARSWGADLLVVGGRRVPFVERLFLGSKARSILRAAPCPVLVAHAPGGEEGAAPPVRRIAVATDFYEPAEAAGRCALELARDLGAELIALHVADPSIWGDLMAPTDSIAPALGPGRVDPEWIERTMRGMLHKFNEEVLAGEAEEVTRPGDPTRQTVEFAREREVDLLLVGTHGPGRLERALLGSVAEGVAERAPCSVVVVHAQGGGA